VRHTRQTIATVYATGGHIEMPWDTYLPTPDAQRYFGRPENYADLTAFVRAMASVLDGYSDAFATGGDIMDGRWLATLPPLALRTDAVGVHAFARARPGDSSAPVAVHLVDWRDEPQPFALSLRPQAFFGNKPLRLRLYTPVRNYDQAAHEKAFRSGDYAGLVEKTELAAGYVNLAEIPALHPWGILVVDPAPGTAPGVWPPAFVSEDSEFHTETTVVLDSATPGARIHYTLDGSVPTARSARYTAPVRIEQSCTVSAIALSDGTASAVATARFAKRQRPPSLVPNGDFDQGLSGWQRVVFPEADPDGLEVAVDPGRRLCGPNSARLLIRKPTGTVYHLRLVHPFQAKVGAAYTLSFRAVADGPVRCRVGLQASATPHKVLGMRHQAIGTIPQRFVLKGHGPTEGDALDYLVQFDVGAAENAGRTLWLDDVLLVVDGDESTKP
jgi:hypothetical protein